MNCVKKSKLSEKFDILTLRETWNVVRGIIVLLKEFEIVTNKWSSDTVPTIHLVIKHIIYLKSKIESLSFQTDVELEKLRTSLLHNIIEQFIPFEDIEIISYFVDPELIYKCKKTSPIQEYIYKGKILVRNMIMKNYENVLNIQCFESSNDETSSDELLYDTINSRVTNYDTQMNDREEESITSDPIDDEINRYMKEAKSKKYKIVKFWNIHKNSFPNIFNVVKDMLVIPATQTSSEREFSKSKEIKRDKRNRMNDQTLQKLTVLSAFTTDFMSNKKTRRRTRRSDINDILNSESVSESELDDENEEDDEDMENDEDENEDEDDEDDDESNER